MANTMYNRLPLLLGNGGIDLSSDTFKCALYLNDFSIDADNAVLGDVTGTESSGAGYTAGGVALASVTWTQTGSAGVAKFNAADSEWTSASFTAAYAVIYCTTSTPADSLVCVIDFGSDKVVTTGTFLITWDNTDNAIFSI